MRWWLRNLGVGVGVGLVVGLVVGGTLGRLFMRLVFLAKTDSRGIETAMGAIIGDFTSPGTLFIYVFGGLMGILLGAGYAVGRTMLPVGTRLRTGTFVFGTTALMVGQIARSNREDFTVLPVTLSVALIAASVAATAAPVPLLLERLVPDRPRQPHRLASGLVLLALAGFTAFGVSGVVIAYSQ